MNKILSKLYYILYKKLVKHLIKEATGSNSVKEITVGNQTFFVNWVANIPEAGFYLADGHTTLSVKRVHLTQSDKKIASILKIPTCHVESLRRSIYNVLAGNNPKKESK